MWVTSTLRISANEDLGTLAEYDPLTLTRVSEFSHGLNGLVTELSNNKEQDDNEQET